MNCVEQLCPNCGLCCDSTLFADVELRAGDDAKQLEKFGLAIFQKAKTKLAFTQPCACFDGKFCKIYDERPKRCQLFECGLLKNVSDGKMTTAAALRKIQKAIKQAESVRSILRQLANSDEQAPLTKRYADAMSAPMNLVNDDAELRGELMLAVNDLMQMLQKDFLRRG